MEILYKIPEPVVNSKGAGALSVAICNAFAAWLVRRYRLNKNGRHARSASP